MTDFIVYNTAPEPDTQTEVKEEVAVSKGEAFKLILWNDDFNTFDHVINCMVKYINKSLAEATDIAFTVHNKGKCIILEGAKADLIESYNILKLQGLTVTLE